MGRAQPRATHSGERGGRRSRHLVQRRGYRVPLETASLLLFRWRCARVRVRDICPNQRASTPAALQHALTPALHARGPASAITNCHFTAPP